MSFLKIYNGEEETSVLTELFNASGNVSTEVFNVPNNNSNKMFGTSKSVIDTSKEIDRTQSKTNNARVDFVGEHVILEPFVKNEYEYETQQVVENECETQQFVENESCLKKDIEEFFEWSVKNQQEKKDNGLMKKITSFFSRVV